MKNPIEYGKYYYRLQLVGGEIVYLYADRIDLTSAGCLVFVSEDRVLNVLNKDAWVSVDAASILDGCPVNVEKEE